MSKFIYTEITSQKEAQDALKTVRDLVIQKSTAKIVDIFNKMYDDEKRPMNDDLSELINQELINNSFMQESLDLTEKQVEILKSNSKTICLKARENFVARIKESTLKEKLMKELIQSVQEIIVRSITQVGDCIKNGVCLPSSIFSVIANGDKKNYTASFHGDVQIPTPVRGNFITSNIVEIMINSAEHFKEIDLNASQESKDA